jgi:hypothetical protein
MFLSNYILIIIYNYYEKFKILEKIYIFNPSKMINITWNVISGLIPEETKEKIFFINEKKNL